MPPENVQPKKMPFEKYTPFLPLPTILPDRTWPNTRIEKAPLWCSVDLRDGNQALIDPMDPARKLRMFNTLVQMGFKEIEVGFPSAQPARLRLRPSADHRRSHPRGRDDPGADAVPRRTDRAHLRVARGLPSRRSCTSTTRPRCCSARSCSAWTRTASRRSPPTPRRCARSSRRTWAASQIRYEYSPESFTGTEIDYAIEICSSVLNVIEPDADTKIIFNLPATVEMYTRQHLRRRHRVLPPQRAPPRPASRCRCTRTTTAAPAWPPPSSA